MIVAINYRPVQWKQEVHDRILVGKRADLAMFGVSVATQVRALVRSVQNLDCIIEKRRGKLRHTNFSIEMLVVHYKAKLHSKFSKNA